MMTSPIKRSNASTFSNVKSKVVATTPFPKAPRKRVAKEQLEIVPADKETLQELKKLKTVHGKGGPQIATSFTGVFQRKDKWDRLEFFIPEASFNANQALVGKLKADLSEASLPFSYDEYWGKYLIRGKLNKDYNPVLPAKGNSCVISGFLNVFAPKGEEGGERKVVYLTVNNLKVIEEDVEDDEEGDVEEDEE